MGAVVVYESHWGNTAAIAREIAAGLGPEAKVLTTDEASADAIRDAQLIVAGAPVIAFSLPSEKMLASLGDESRKAPSPPDLAHPSMRSWLAGLPQGHGHSVAFETGVRWSPGGATGAIDRGLAGAGYCPVAKSRRFVVKGMYGPFRDGELERARQWGAELAEFVTADGTAGDAS